MTDRCIFWPLSCSLTQASTVSHQVVASVTTVGGFLLKCCSSSVTDLAIGWNSQSATVHNCRGLHHVNVSYLILQLMFKLTKAMCSTLSSLLYTLHETGAPCETKSYFKVNFLFFCLLYWMPDIVYHPQSGSYKKQCQRMAEPVWYILVLQAIITQYLYFTSSLYILVH